MSRSSQKTIAKVVVKDYGQTYAEEAGVRIKNAPAALYQLLNAALLLSARISVNNSVRAARALVDAKLTTPTKMADASWQHRVDVISNNGSKRYDESGARMLGDTARRVLDQYDGDLRKLRAAADRDPAAEHRLLQEFKGIGKVGADIFLREVQGLWAETHPFADARVTKAAKNVGLPSDPNRLAQLVAKKGFPRLVVGLIRIDLAGAKKERLRKARS